MNNEIWFENGIYHVFTDDEMRILKSAIRDFEASDIICSSVEREKEFQVATDNLKALFLHHLD